MTHVLGRGPVAEVYAVGGAALKVFPGRFDRRALAAIERERVRLARAAAPVLPVDRVEVVDGRHAFRMELCAESLASRVARTGPLASTEVTALGEVLSRALAAAHRLGVLHGGVSPANVLFRTNGEAVLADFGVAQRQAFRRDPLYGVEWKAPEMLRTGEAGRAVDLYGLGAVLRFALTGESPHPGRIGETGERIRRVLGDPVPAISRPDVPIELSTAIARLLAPDPAMRRAPLTEDVAEDLPEPRPATRPRVWRRAVAATAVVVAAVTAVVLWPQSAPESPAPVLELAEPTDFGDQVELRWTTSDDRLFFVVVFWAEDGPRKSATARRERTKRVPVEPDRGYCFLVRGSTVDGIVESRSVAVRGADCPG